MMDTITFDFHSHILPGADHGASDTAEAMTILHTAFEAGIETMAATPHFYPHRHRVDDFLKRRNAAYDRLREHLDEKTPKILLGVEALICPGIDNMEGIEKLTLEGTNILLLELPFVVSEHTDELFETVERLIYDNGYTVFMAHANRYPTASVERMASLGAKLQLNLEDICSFGERSRVKHWLENGWVSAVGSDVHHDEKIFKKLKKSARIVSSSLEKINRPLES